MRRPRVQWDIFILAKLDEKSNQKCTNECCYFSDCSKNKLNKICHGNIWLTPPSTLATFGDASPQHLPECHAFSCTAP